MEKPFKFRRANELAGAFVILSILLLTSGILLSGRVKGWFKPQRTYEMILPQEGTLGIRKGTEVHILGSRAGFVRDVILRHKGNRHFNMKDVPLNEVNMVAILDVRSELVAFVGKESTAELKYDLGGFGAPYLEISRGTLPREDGDVQVAFRDSGKTEINSAIEEVREALIPAIKEIETTSSKIQQLADSLGSPESEFQQTMAGVNKVLQDINAGKGPAGMFLKDETAADQFRSSLTAFEAAMANLSTATDGMEQVTARLPDTIDLSDTAIREMTQTAIDLQDAADEYEVLAEGLQRHWFVRKSVQKVEQERASESSNSANSASSDNKDDGGSKGFLFFKGGSKNKDNKKEKKDPEPEKARIEREDNGGGWFSPRQATNRK